MHLVFGGISVLLSIVKQTDEFDLTVVDGVSERIVVISIIWIISKSQSLVPMNGNTIIESKA